MRPSSRENASIRGVNPSGRTPYPLQAFCHHDYHHADAEHFNEERDCQRFEPSE
jgi:hypothetical protein